MPIRRTNKIVKEIDKLHLSVKLLLVEDIWDDIAKHNAELPMPEWQKNELDKRYSEYTSVQNISLNNICTTIGKSPRPKENLGTPPLFQRGEKFCFPTLKKGD